MNQPTKTCVLALDQGTTSSRAILFDKAGRLIAKAQQEFPQHVRSFLHAGVATDGSGEDRGIVEHDPEDIWQSQIDCARRVLVESGIDARQVAAVGITNQRETTILWERATGQPVAPAIVWQSRISTPICTRLKASGLESEVRRRTGLLLDPYFSASKIVYLLETIPGLRQRCLSGEILFGTVDSFLIWRLTGGRVHATDPTNACRTLLFDIEQMGWSEALCDIFDVPRALLPEVRPSSGSFGEVDPRWFGVAIPIAGCAGDQQAAAFAQGCTQAGKAKNTYGTGAFLLFSTGAQPVTSSNGLLTTLGCALGTEPAAVGKSSAASCEPHYALEGSVFIGGAIVGWLRDGLGMIEQAGDIEALAASVDSSGGVVLVPALTGLGAPYWDPFARGLIIGISRATTQSHIARAALESIALSVADVALCMQQDAGMGLQRLRVDGGACVNNLLLQMQADVLGLPVERPVVLETTALGAALLAGIAVGFFSGSAAVDEARQVERVFEPAIGETSRRKLMQTWHTAIERCRDWARPS